ncbi:dnaJ homolog subfamily C member 7 isoform X1 [Nasonia vitripennis]|uniref:J domain-containing protein n=1 Tax=Nasonia vitripennis TaxID=7425 RepID=A0A7M7G3X3_NASVI|nr:dnaJ homolog subfamily C member 7 isoform X1 [Nasonia vitripennis]
MADETINVDPEPASGPSEPKIPKPEILAELKKEEANQLYSAKQYKQALLGYNEVIELCPDVARYYSNRCACYMMLSQYRDALKDAKKCLELDPGFVKAYTRLIKCSLMLGDIVETETAISKLEQLEPTKQSIAAELNDLAILKRFIKEAEVAYSIKDYRKVVYCMDRCAEVSPFCARFKITKAECLAYLGRYSEAEMGANDVLHTDKQNADAIYVRGTCLYYQDNIDQAFKHFQQVLRLAPDHTKALDIYKRAKLLKQKKEEGNVAFKAERYQEAYNLYTEALLVDPQNTKANAKLHFNKATVAAKLKKLKESVSECNEALKLDDNYLKAILRRAACYMELQDYEEAVRDYERACKMDKSRDNKRLLLEAKMALKKSKRKDYYKILGIDKNASTEDIKKAYRKRAMVHHPDRHANATDGEKKEQEKKFKEVGEAYGILSDPKKRSRYDSGHDLEESDYNFNDMDMDSRFQAFFDSPFASDCGRGFRFEFV